MAFPNVRCQNDLERLLHCYNNTGALEARSIPSLPTFRYTYSTAASAFLSDPVFSNYAPECPLVGATQPPDHPRWVKIFCRACR